MYSTSNSLPALLTPLLTISVQKKTQKDPRQKGEHKYRWVCTIYFRSKPSGDGVFALSKLTPTYSFLLTCTYTGVADMPSVLYHYTIHTNRVVSQISTLGNELFWKYTKM